MSSTSNVQNLLTNVFRPTFVFDTTNGVYQSKLELTNIDSISANTVYGFTAAFGDASGNVYIGINSGNAHSLLASTSNSSNTFVGTNAGSSASNVKNGVFLGYRSGFGTSNSSNSISIGANTLNGGNSNTYIGCSTGIVSGSNNIFLGPGISNGGYSISNCLIVGSGSNTTIAGDLLNKRIGINITPSNFISNTTIVPLTLDVNGYTRIGTSNNGGLGINKEPGLYALDVNGEMRVTNGYGTITFERSGSNTVTSISNTTTYPNASSTLQVTGGYFSSNGTTGASTTTTVPFVKGMFMLSATSNTTRHGYIGIASSSSAYTLVSAGSNGTLITANNSTLVVASGTVGWSITYFPTP
jgi:hypothetical protein